MKLLLLALHLFTREPRRSVAALIGIAIAAALMTSVVLFGAASGTTVIQRALADLPVDAQVVLAAGVGTDGAMAILLADPAVRSVEPFDIAHFDAAASTKAGTATQTSVGVLIGIDPAYTQSTGLFGLSSGERAANQIAVSRDLASNLGVVPGDSITFTLPGGQTVTLTVSGVISITGADLVLGPIDATHRAAGANSPTNVAVMDRADLERLVLPRIPAAATAADPATIGGGSGGSTPVFAGEPAIRRELHVRLDHAQLPGEPVAAQSWLDTVRRRVDRDGAGSFVWVDDAGASLEPLGADLAWGQVLFIFLALPGFALALALSRLAADATADTTRRHVALLRARGARRRDLRVVFVGTTILTALAGSAMGVVIGALIGLAVFGGNVASAGLVPSLVRAALISIGLTTLLASLATAAPLRSQLREEIASGRQELQRSRPSLWQRLYLDVLAVALGAVVYAVAGGNGLHPILDAEGNPTVTLALTAFVAPLLFWIGGTLVLLRLAEIALGHGQGLAQFLALILGPGGRLAGESLRERAAAAARAIVVLALAVSFATSVLVFHATYQQQQRIDAQLTLGADLRAVPSARATVGDVGRLPGPGVTATTSFVDRVVYVGPEAQDLLAIDPATLPAVAPLADSFFAGLTASAAMQALRARPDAVLVSAETAKDYSVVPGDRIRIRIPDATGHLRTVDFTMAGIALEFPTAPRDAFLVANLAYVITSTGDDQISFVLARADGDVGVAAANLARRLGSGWTVTDIDATTARLANAITAVDLSGLVVLDVAFALVIAGVGVTLFLLAGLAERRREIATLIAIGAEPRQIRFSLLGETLVVGLAGIATGLVTGGLVGVMLLQILAGVFDPPADVPAVPLALIGTCVAAVATALAIGLGIADRGIARLGVVAALRER